MSLATTIICAECANHHRATVAEATEKGCPHCGAPLFKRPEEDDKRHQDTPPPRVDELQRIREDRARYATAVAAWAGRIRRVRRAWLFGSYVRENKVPRDLDVAIELYDAEGDPAFAAWMDRDFRYPLTKSLQDQLPGVVLHLERFGDENTHVAAYINMASILVFSREQAEREQERESIGIA
jgi:predicted  nucleic acid-binding Zn-ribbon protein